MGELERVRLTMKETVDLHVCDSCKELSPVSLGKVAAVNIFFGRTEDVTSWAKQVREEMTRRRS